MPKVYLYVQPMETTEINDINRRLETMKWMSEHYAVQSYLDPRTTPPSLVGRDDQGNRLVELLNEANPAPLIAVDGGPGTGKTSIVDFVCKNIPKISFRMVNLKEANTVFGCANLITRELGGDALASAKGTNKSIQVMTETIESIVKQEGKKLFALALDEADALFLDPRADPSDFIYKLLWLGERLRSSGYYLSIISISNTPLADYLLDSRISSRAGSNAIIHFPPYTEQELSQMLKERASKALKEIPDPEPINYIARLCANSSGGDARKAIELLAASIDWAVRTNIPISKNHVDIASLHLRLLREGNSINKLTPHRKTLCLAMAAILYDKNKASTSEIYNLYALWWLDKLTLLTYKAASDELKGMEDIGVISGEKRSLGRHGIKRFYSFANSTPEEVGNAINGQFWATFVTVKSNQKLAEDKKQSRSKHYREQILGLKVLEQWAKTKKAMSSSSAYRPYLSRPRVNK